MNDGACSECSVAQRVPVTNICGQYVWRCVVLRKTEPKTWRARTPICSELSATGRPKSMGQCWGVNECAACEGKAQRRPTRRKKSGVQGVTLFPQRPSRGILEFPEPTARCPVVTNTLHRVEGGRALPAQLSFDFHLLPFTPHPRGQRGMPWAYGGNRLVAAEGLFE